MKAAKVSALESITATICFSAKDWSVDRRDAWIYGIAVGWGRALKEVAELHGWTAENIAILKAHLKAYVRASRTAGKDV